MAPVKFNLYSYRVRNTDNGGWLAYTFEEALPEPVPNLTATGEQIGFTNAPYHLRLAGRACYWPAEGERCSLEREGDDLALVLRTPRANPGTSGWRYSAGEFVTEFGAETRKAPKRFWFEPAEG